MKRRAVYCIAGAFLVMLIPLSCWMYLALGDAPPGDALKRFESQPNYYDGRFHNADPAAGVAVGPLDAAGIIVEHFRKPPRTRPAAPVPSVTSDLNAVTRSASVVWFGHSSYLIRSKGYTVLVDPVLCGYAGPLPCMMRAFRGSDAYHPGDLPAIDLLVITHDHFDHLSRETVIRLKKKIRRIIAPVGVGSHFVFWGFDPSMITELSWNETSVLRDGVRITAVPAQHLSGRGFVRDRTLWASFVLRVHGVTLFIGGDGGYGAHFREIGATYGPFDLVMLENGRYNRRWSAIHMRPEEVIAAAIDLRARMVMPVHWGKFETRSHDWNEPIRRLLREAGRRGVVVTVPMIGETYPVGAPARRAAWWELD
ncbi:MAG: MBL fold metallo-hydrolase [Spirochaetes bacterium]|nr:MBL fold metallo-hydrolase [Spirochaetota bacterium]